MAREKAVARGAITHPFDKAEKDGAPDFGGGIKGSY
jgi:hypothetical protein